MASIMSCISTSLSVLRCITLEILLFPYLYLDLHLPSTHLYQRQTRGIYERISCGSDGEKSPHILSSRVLSETDPEGRVLFNER